MDAVGGDEDISPDLPPVGKARDHRLAAVVEADAPGAEVDNRGIELSGQKLLQLGPVDGREPRSPPPGHQVAGYAQQPCAIGPYQPLPGNRRGQLRHLAGQPDRLEGRHRVRPQPHPGSNLFKRRCLLVDLGG
jgi:hypothetical protein